MRALAAMLLTIAIDLLAQQTVRLKPSSSPSLPKPIVRELELRACTIPQPVGARELSNVIQGEFAKPGQKDWAVLCSVDGIASILVFWNGSPKNPAMLATRDTDYSRIIEPVDAKFILDHYKIYGGPKPPPLNHGGIADGVIEKGSVVQYFYNGKWLQLTGAD